MRKEQINEAAKKFANSKSYKQSSIYSSTKGAEWADSNQVCTDELVELLRQKQ